MRHCGHSERSTHKNYVIRFLYDILIFGDISGLKSVLDSFMNAS
jgi:hypothetical protein